MIYNQRNYIFLYGNRQSMGAQLIEDGLLNLDITATFIRPWNTALN